MGGSAGGVGAARGPAGVGSGSRLARQVSPPSTRIASTSTTQSASVLVPFRSKNVGSRCAGFLASGRAVVMALAVAVTVVTGIDYVARALTLRQTSERAAMKRARKAARGA